MTRTMIVKISSVAAAALIASAGMAIAADAPWERARDRSQDCAGEGIQQQDRDQVSRPADAGSGEASLVSASCEASRTRSHEESGTPTRSRATSGTPAARGVTGLARAQERASEQAQPVLARVRERIEAKKSASTAAARTRTRTAAEGVPPAEAAGPVGPKPANPGADCPDPGENCPNPDAPGPQTGAQEREQKGAESGQNGASGTGSGSRN